MAPRIAARVRDPSPNDAFANRSSGRSSSRSHVSPGRIPASGTARSDLGNCERGTPVTSDRCSSAASRCSPSRRHGPTRTPASSIAKNLRSQRQNARTMSGFVLAKQTSPSPSTLRPRRAQRQRRGVPGHRRHGRVGSLPRCIPRTRGACARGRGSGVVGVRIGAWMACRGRREPRRRRRTSTGRARRRSPRGSCPRRAGDALLDVLGACLASPCFDGGDGV